MKYLSICSGIEAATVAWHPFGWTPVAFSEIEPFTSAVLAHHYPDVPNLGDMTKFEEWNFGPSSFDVLVGGTPCQAFSVAGLREGLNDHRGNLTLTFCELANHFNPEFVVWENVPGVLSDKTGAFGCLLAGLAGEVEALIPPGGRWKNAGYVSGPKRTVAWRVLDAQHFGVAQRRRRVFVVASAGDVCASEVFFERESLRRDSAPSREKGERIAPCVTNGPPFSRTGNERVEADAMIPVAARMVAFGEYVDDGTASAMKARDYKDATDLVAQPITQYGDIAASLTARYDSSPCADRGANVVAQPIPLDLRNAGRDPEKHDEINRQGIGVGDEGDPAHTVTTACVHGVAQPIAMRESGSGYWMEDTVAGTLDANMGMSGHANRPAVIKQASMAVRRLTPVECERLQGFPDNYTNIPWRKSPESPDGPRYKALGNSMAVPCMRWIGSRIELCVRQEVA